MIDNKVLMEVLSERARQHKLWGVQNHKDGTGLQTDIEIAEAYKNICNAHAKAGTVTWRDILQEEFSEALAERNPPALREELIQVAAVATAWVEAIDRRMKK